MRIKQSVGILAITGSKNKHTILDQGGIGLHASAFKRFVHFLWKSFFPVTKCVQFSSDACHIYTTDNSDWDM